MTLLSPAVNTLIIAIKKPASKICRDFDELSYLQKPNGWEALSKGFLAKTKDNLRDTIFDELNRFYRSLKFLFDPTELPDDFEGVVVNSMIGASNFVRSIPFFLIGLTLFRDGIISCSVIYNPISGDIFWAEERNGAYYQDIREETRRIRVNDVIIDCGLLFGCDDVMTSRKDVADFLKKLCGSARVGVRSFGCPALDLAYVASGRMAGSLCTSNVMGILPSLLLVQEAGGVILDLSGRRGINAVLDSDECLTLTPNLYKKMY